MRFVVLELQNVYCCVRIIKRTDIKTVNKALVNLN